MRPNDESTIRAGARAHDAGADTSNGTKQIEIQVEIPLREGDKISGPYPHGNQWRLQIRGADGKVRRIAFPTRDAAVRAQALAGRELSSTTVDSAVTTYLRQLHEGGVIKDGTKVTHWYRLRAFFRLGAKDGVLIENSGGLVRHLSPEKCQALYDQLRVESAVDTHRGCLTLAKAFGGWCVKQGLLKTNPLAEIEPQGERKRGKEQLRVDEARRFIATCCAQADQGDVPAVAVMTALLLGTRPGEIVCREVRDLDDDGRLLWITKAKTKAGERTLEIPAFLRPYLLRVAKGKQPTDRLFTEKDRHWMLYHTRRLCGLAGVTSVCAHSLRGLHSSLATERGATGHVVAKALGHTSFSTTRKHYVKPGTVERVAQGKVTGMLDPTAARNRKRGKTSGKAVGISQVIPDPKNAPASIA
ncbi:MAG: tyrosine-type recombinase/integrase [Kofleriaceae bacterium]|nr:tyrosine-type recombinase/integrase [Kofleriaceae bacterium]MCL4223787.1 tyrosine-type recombinase/integrase [Myxococcales bacterium]